ncbi:type V toxin-antitoxin system endoribonuclease antitoxin GhoS [Pseudescherichia vulneris]|uniref:type V toxin-antitoxin system endoribonuclease antitoxin GhoS n=1 Tax=Pseudescherichia vulneris TaxID=566 RepID=UPI00227C6333|nr:type V toxin-antitoxin system endoribonuclease antitoxin GhoS [Pseudescherichia vulneris]WAH53158.1 type V toxin-antitoxin system endoribonuclease antitoxin GhoS [Pseudescherichia vulneris]
MASGDITRYVITVKFHEHSLTEINELNNTFTLAGYQLTLSDDDGKVHELGTNTFGLVSPLSEDDIKAQALALAESSIDQRPEITVMTWENWLKTQQQ